MKLFLLALSFASALLWSQTSTSQITGTVSDSSQAVVPGAKVTATNEATGITYTQQTTAAGLYAFPSVPVGSYTIKVEAAGFRTYERRAVVVQINTPLQVDVAMEVGATTETVKVEASAEQLQTANATLGGVVEQKAIVNLPLNGRNPLSLLVLEAGVTQRSGGTLNVNGARNGANNVTIDGIEANESTSPNAVNNVFRVNPDNVQEFKVTTSNQTPEEGRNSGATVSIATRSGTNEFHGTLFHFFRNTALNAQEFFSKAQDTGKPVIKLNQYGWEFGGPIRKNKTFFFGSWQGQKVNFEDPVDKQFGESVDVYGALARTGIFRYFRPNAANPVVINGQRITQNSPLLVDRATGQLAAGVRTCGSETDLGCVASYNIPGGDPRGIGLNRTVSSLFGNYPLPNNFNVGDGLNTGGYQWNPPFRIRGPHYMARVDHTFNEYNTLFVRYLGSEQNTLGGDPLNGRPQIFPNTPPRGEVFRPAHNAAVSYRRVFSPRLVNELTLGFARFNFLFTRGEANPAFPNIPPFTFNNSDVDYTNAPRTARQVNTYQLIDNLSFITGKHVYKFGGNIRFYQHNDQRGDLGGGNTTPAISLSATIRPPTGFPAAPGIAAPDQARLLGAINDLLGIPARLQQIFLGDIRSNNFLPFRAGERSVTLWNQGQRAKQFNFFAQDEWKLSRKLTMTYGVRWEINLAPTEAGGRAFTPDRMIDGRDGPVTFVNTNRWYQNNNFGAIAPRLAFAYSPDQKTVFRTGYGIAFDPISTFQVTAAAVSVPGQSFTCSATPGGATTPGCATVPDVRLGQGFPLELPAPTAQPASFLRLPAQNLANSPAVTVFDQNMKLPTVHQWNFSIQRELPKGIVAQVSYVGRRGTRLYRSFDINQVTATRPLLDSFRIMQGNLNNGCNPDGTGCRAGGTGTPVPLVTQGVLTTAFVNTTATQNDLRQNAAGNFAGRVEQTFAPNITAPLGMRPNQQFGRITYLDNGGDSIYHSLQVTARKRFDSAGFLLGLAYTLGKSIDNQSVDPVTASANGGLSTTNARTPMDINNFALERGRSDFDQRHVLNLTWIYELPFGQGKMIGKNASGILNHFIGGWSLNGFSTTMTGEPYSIRSGVLTHNFSAQSRAALANPSGGLPESKLQDKAGVIGPVMFQDASAFVIPGAGETGFGRNLFQGPGYWNVDMGVTKAIKISERYRLFFRTEAFNLFNRANFRNPRDASVGTPSIISPVFAQTCCVTLSTASSTSVNQNGESWRVLQLALKLQF